jgi:hypothetical protein
MSGLLREVIPLALAAAISPVIFLLQLNTLTGDRPIVRGAALTAVAAIVLIVVSTIGRPREMRDSTALRRPSLIRI